MCKLVYPHQPSIAGEKPEDFINAIMQDGRFVLEWDGKQETITWRHGYPIP